jgi:hypothetical protein
MKYLYVSETVLTLAEKQLLQAALNLMGLVLESSFMEAWVEGDDDIEGFLAGCQWCLRKECKQPTKILWS